MRLQREWPTCHLFDVRIDAATAAQVVSAVDDAISTRKRLLIGVVNAAKMVKMRSDETLRRAVLGADLILADGMSIVWSCGLLGMHLPERVTGIDLMNDILKLCHKKAHRIFLLGATDDVLETVKFLIRKDYPGVVIAGSSTGYYSAEDEVKIAEKIAAARPDALFVAMSSPAKERFLLRWWNLIEVPVCHGVGGAFDVFAGKVKRAPKFWQNWGIEWLYRTLQEPTRLGPRYLITNAIYISWLAGELAGRLRRRWFGNTSGKLTPQRL